MRERSGGRVGPGKGPGRWPLSFPDPERLATQIFTRPADYRPRGWGQPPVAVASYSLALWAIVNRAMVPDLGKTFVVKSPLTEP